MSRLREDGLHGFAVREVGEIRAGLCQLEAALLNLWVDAVAHQPVFADHVRTAARFTHSALMTLDASTGANVLLPHPRDADLVDDVIDLTAENHP